jgi:hypothetical protein
MAFYELFYCHLVVTFHYQYVLQFEFCLHLSKYACCTGIAWGHAVAQLVEALCYKLEVAGLSPG